MVLENFEKCYFSDHYENKIFDKQDMPDVDLVGLLTETFLPE